MFGRSRGSEATRNALTVSRLGGTIALGYVMAACAADEPTALRSLPDVNMAKGGPSSGVTVSSTDPAYGFQGDSMLTVRVRGSGFATGARASWQLNGDTTHVHEISTTYVSSTEVVAVIKVDADAPIALYDVVVTLIGGKKGVGAEMFAVKSVNERQQLPIPIAMTVQGVGPLGPYRVLNDGRGDYVHGLHGMTVLIDEFGNLQITPTSAESIPAQRQLYLDFSVPADPLNAYRPDTTGQTNFKIVSNDYGNPRIQDLGINGNPTSACYRVSFAFRNATTRHTVTFNTSVYPQVAFALVTRTGVSPDTWTMTTDPVCGVNSEWGGVKSTDLTRKNAPTVFRGFYVLPFSILLRAL